VKLLPVLRSFALSSTMLLTACPAGSPKPPPTPTQPSDPLLTADGQHFAASRTYQGECMPAQSRGGCYSFTFAPDGTYRQMLLDAAVTGTYVIAGDSVSLTPDGDMPPATMTLSSDRTKLDDYTYQAVAP
jgi:hypothetical protein